MQDIIVESLSSTFPSGGVQTSASGAHFRWVERKKVLPWYRNMLAGEVVNRADAEKVKSRKYHKECGENIQKNEKYAEIIWMYQNP